MKFIKSIFLFLFSILLIIFLFQFIFHLNSLKIINQKIISRNILYNLDFYYHTFYPNTYNRDLKNYTAILGDSYAFGQGDEWLNNNQMYSSLHFLREADKKNYVNFSIPGGRSITSFREFFYRYNHIENSFFLPKIDKPNKIIFFFYEGNDIIDNYQWFKKLNINNATIENFVKNEIENFAYYKNRKFDIYFPIFNTSKKIFYEKLIHYVYLPYVRSNYKIKEKHKKTETIKNYIIFKDNKSLIYEGYVENPGYNLNLNQVDISLEIFYESIKYFKKKFPKTAVEILYIPSHATIYEWKDDVIIKYENNTYLADKIKKDKYYNHIVDSMINFTIKNDIKFTNSTNNLKNISNFSFLHGIIDKNHFSHIGYKILSKTILE
jgi:hypothetical protein